MLNSQDFDRTVMPAVKQHLPRIPANDQTADVRGNQVAVKPAKVWLVLDSLHGGHDFVVPTSRDFRRRLLSKVGNAGFEISPELRAEDEAHERLAARAKPLCKASTQSAAEAGRAEPLFKASSTHC